MNQSKKTDIAFKCVKDDIPVINMHPPNALSVFYYAIVKLLIPDHEIGFNDGIKKYENRRYRIPEGIRQNNNQAVVFMTKGWPKSGCFGHATSSMVAKLKTVSQTYSDGVWAFFRQFCDPKYANHDFGRLIGICEFEEVLKTSGWTDVELEQGVAPGNHHVWKIVHISLFHTWFGYTSVECKWHKFNSQRIRSDHTELCALTQVVIIRA